MAKEIQKKAGVSGNSVAGKSFQIFTVSEELLAKVVEATLAGEKEARSSKTIQSFEVFCHGFRQNISLGRLMVVPPSVCNDRGDFPTALLYGAIVRVFGTAGEEVADLIEQRIGGGEFDEYSQLDFDALKEKLFVDVRTGEEASLIVFAPNWMNSREYICFHFTKDVNELKNNLRHQVFSAYYNPAVSSAFNALMTNVDTTKVDVTDITPKLSYPFLTENPLKAFPQLEKQGSYKRATILLNRKTADEITKQTLDPQELDVFDSLNQALETSLLPDADGAQGEGGFKAPEAHPGVPREASDKKEDKKADHCECGRLRSECVGGYAKNRNTLHADKNASKKVAHIDANGICPGCKKAGGECACKGCTCKQACAPHETPFTNVGPGTEAADKQEASAPAMKESVQGDEGKADEESGSPIGIAIDETGVPRRKEEEKKASQYSKDPRWLTTKYSSRCKKCGREIQAGERIYYYPASKSVYCDAEDCGQQAARDFEATAFDERQGSAKNAANPSNRRRESSHPETLRVSPGRLSSAVSAKFNGGYVDKTAMDEVLRPYAEKSGLGDNNGQAPHAAADHAKQVEAGAYGDDPLSRRSNEKWGSAEIPPKVKRSNKEVLANYIADVVAAEIDEPIVAMSHKAKQARAKNESLLSKFRPKVAETEIDFDSVWDEITEDIGPAPLVEVDTDTSNPAPSNTEGESQSTGGGAKEEPRSGARPNKKDVEDLPEALRSPEPEDEKEISDSDAEQEEAAFDNSVEEHYHGASVDSKFAEFVDEVYDDVNNEEEPTRLRCDQCQMVSVNGVPIHEEGCPNDGARWDAENGMWIPQRECFECGMEVDEDDPCCAAPVEDEADDARFGSAKNADTADNEYDIDSAANPSTKENGTSGTVECHQDYDGEQSKGTDRPKPGVGADIKQAGGVKRLYEDEMIRREDLLKSIRHGDRVTILVPAGIGRGGQEWKEATGTAVMHSAEGGWVLNMGGRHGTPGLASERNIVRVKKGKPVPGQERLGSGKKADTVDNPSNEKGGESAIERKTDREISDTQGTTVKYDVTGSAKKADTADNPYNMADGEGAPDNKKVVQKKDTTGPTPDNTKKAYKVGQWEVRGGKCKCPIFAKDGHCKHSWTVEQHEKKKANQNKGVKQIVGPKHDHGIEGDIAQARSESASPDAVDKDIPQETTSVYDAGKRKNSAEDKTAGVWMNEYDIDDAVRTLGDDPVLGKAARFLAEFRDEVNSHSDGWAYWRAPAAAAGQLMALIQQGMAVKRGQQFQETAPLINGKALAKALGPIKAFMTRKGLAAGMQMPKLAADISGDIAEARAELDYDKSGIADEPMATRTESAEQAGGRKNSAIKQIVGPKHDGGIEGDIAEAEAGVDFDKALIADEARAEDTVNPSHFAAAAKWLRNAIAKHKMVEDADETPAEDDKPVEDDKPAEDKPEAKPDETKGKNKPAETPAAGEAKVPTIVIYNGGTGGASTVDTDSGSGPGGDGPGSDGTGGSGEGSGGGGGGGGGRGTPRNPEEPADAVSPGVDSENREQGNLPEPQGNQSKGKPLATKPELRGDAPVKPQPPHRDADDKVSSKKACGESQPESIEFDWGAGDLADIVLVEEDEEEK